MNRGEIWTAAGGANYMGKPRPVLILQDDRFDATGSVTVCPLTSDSTEIPLLRIPLEASSEMGLAQPSRIMVDKVTTMPRARLGEYVGRVSDDDMAELSRALIVFLGFA